MFVFPVSGASQQKQDNKKRPTMQALIFIIGLLLYNPLGVFVLRTDPPLAYRNTFFVTVRQFLDSPIQLKTVSFLRLLPIPCFNELL